MDPELQPYTVHQEEELRKFYRSNFTVIVGPIPPGVKQVEVLRAWISATGIIPQSFTHRRASRNCLDIRLKNAEEVAAITTLDFMVDGARVGVDRCEGPVPHTYLLHEAYTGITENEIVEGLTEANGGLPINLISARPHYVTFDSIRIQNGNWTIKVANCNSTIRHIRLRDRHFRVISSSDCLSCYASGHMANSPECPNKRKAPNAVPTEASILPADMRTPPSPSVPPLKQRRTMELEEVSTATPKKTLRRKKKSKSPNEENQNLSATSANDEDTNEKKGVDPRFESTSSEVEASDMDAELPPVKHSATTPLGQDNMIKKPPRTSRWDQEPLSNWADSTSNSNQFYSGLPDNLAGTGG